MEIPQNHRQRQLYHCVCVEDLICALDRGGLLSAGEEGRLGLPHRGMAGTRLWHRQGDMAVPIGPGGRVEDYVPLCFASATPLLLDQLNRKLVDQPRVCFVLVPIDRLLEERVVFTDTWPGAGSAPRFYRDPARLDRLNWPAIDRQAWVWQDRDEMRARMAEALVYRRLPLDWIAELVVFDSQAGAELAQAWRDRGLPCPPISIRRARGRDFYFTKRLLPGREEESLVTGPAQLFAAYQGLLEAVFSAREAGPAPAPRFRDLEQALAVLEEDFCAIAELQGIWGLETSNPSHHETVSGHTLHVVSNLRASPRWQALDPARQRAVLFSVYLHDIGKGPADKWADRVQPIYQDHPADAIPMLRRILTEEFLQLSRQEVEWLCLLVVYHDLLGDIISKGRSEEELFRLGLGEGELNMLAALSGADVNAISAEWGAMLEAGLPGLLKRALAALE